MNLYLLERNGMDTAETYDAASGMVLAASSAERARQLAADAARAEGGGVWLDTRFTTITRLGTADAAAVEGLILADVHES